MIRHQYVEGVPLPRNAATKDHVEPRTYEGETSWWNMVAACSQCNNLRGEIEAEAFFNLMQKWFKRDSTLRARWHTIDRAELAELKRECMSVHVRQLRGLGKRHIEFAFRHFDFVNKWQRRHLRA